MEFQSQFAGGQFELTGGPEPSLRFVFRTHDLAEVERHLRGMFVELTLRIDGEGFLAYSLGIPDRGSLPWMVPVPESDRALIAARSRFMGRCPTSIQDADGRELDLDHFSKDLEQDWSGRTATAFAAYLGGGLDDAELLLSAVVRESPRGQPQAHHLLGRCRRRRGELEEAIACYRRAVRAACNPLTGRMIPYAAAPLSDMGVAFKLLGDHDRATCCFLHSLSLRPNHPEALLSFFSLFPEDERMVLFGAARVLAIGGSEELVAQFVGNYATFTGADPERITARAERLSRSVDLGRWPFQRPDLGSFQELERRLGAPAVDEEPAATSARRLKC